MTTYQYSIIANIFRYPDNDFKEQMLQVKNLIKMSYPELNSTFDKFLEGASDSNSINEEHYLKTFEIEGVCCMDVGHVLFGEDYKRGDFLAKIQGEQNICGNDTGIELADHLPNILSLMANHNDAEFVEELGFGLLITAVNALLEKFSEAENHYKYAFETLLGILKIDFENSEVGQYTIPTKSEGCFSEEYSCGGDFKKK